MPGTADGGPILLTARSASGVNVSVSVADALVGSDVPDAGTAVAVFASVPLAAGSIVPVAVNVITPLAGIVTVALMWPLPEAAGQVAPPRAAQLHVTPVSSAGNVSVTTALVAALGPWFPTVMV